MSGTLSLPKINTKDKPDDIPSIPVELSEAQLSNILTNMVRQKYFNYLEGLLTSNYESSMCPNNPLPPLSLTDIKKCAEYLEFQALRSCMVVNLYRKSILNIFKEIRDDTCNKKLNVHLSAESISQRKSRRSIQIQTDLTTSSIIEQLSKPVTQPKRKHLRNVRVQTVQTDANDTTVGDSENEITISLDERIRIFQKQYRYEERKQMESISYCLPDKRFDQMKVNRKRRRSLISLEIPSPHSSIDSSAQRSVDRVDSRLDSSTDNERVHTTNAEDSSSVTLSTPIATVDDNVDEKLEALFGDDDEIDIFGETIKPMEQSYEPNQPIQNSDSTNDHSVECEDNKISLNDDTKAMAHDYTQELKNSMWPCELHMQKLRLHKVLTKNADKGIRYSENLRKKFEELFGPEDEDDLLFAPYSPSIELDEILMSSCKKRVAPWIVKHLKVMSVGLIEDRFLFKKVAKHIAEKVIIRDQYPDEHQIQREIKDFFRTHSYIGCIDDIT